MTSLNQRIQEFYDGSTRLWLDTWGEHMHHGYYGPEGKVKKERKQAQIDLIEEMLRWGEAAHATRIFDAGCGVGGSSRYLATRFDATAYGVTLSPVQRDAGRTFNQEVGLGDRVEIDARDMMAVTRDDGPFDLIWSMESAEHIQDKRVLIAHFFDLLEPGGKLIMATWCRRDVPPQLSIKEDTLLKNLYEAYQLPPMNSQSDYEALAINIGFQDVQTGDWSDAVAPFWNEVIRSAFEIRNFGMLMATGWKTIKGAWAMKYMRSGYKAGLIRYVTLSATKPIS